MLNKSAVTVRDLMAPAIKKRDYEPYLTTCKKSGFFPMTVKPQKRRIC